MVGISHHIVGHELPLLLKRMNSAEPQLVPRMRVRPRARCSTSSTAASSMRRSCSATTTEGRAAKPFWRKPSAGWPRPISSIVPAKHCGSATQAEPCSVRSMAIDALKGAGIAWTEVFVGGGIATTGAAVSAGLAVAALGRRVAPSGTIDVAAKFGLPQLASRDVVLYSNVTDRDTKNLLKTLAATIRATAN